MNRLDLHCVSPYSVGSVHACAPPQFEEFNWNFEKATFPRMKDSGISTAEVSCRAIYIWD